MLNKCEWLESISFYQSCSWLEQYTRIIDRPMPPKRSFVRRGLVEKNAPKRCARQSTSRVMVFGRLSMSLIKRGQEGNPLPFTLNLRLGFYTQFKRGEEPFGVLSALHTVMELCPRLATRFLCRGLCLATRFLCRGLCLSECKRQHWTCPLHGFPHQQSPVRHSYLFSIM